MWDRLFEFFIKSIHYPQKLLPLDQIFDQINLDHTALNSNPIGFNPYRSEDQPLYGFYT